ncbi:MAG: peptide deformylase [Omnitrophica WOR_2 bacterium RIFCSPLOWO2_12_FULL_50_9]|nr:MAG: peptide deformylase [Omnitrophica WOR_2 bacterium RIFCSPHIGHO2_02_FULL_50_17]OGX42377.1 MAG: peptide deformylase [Omnitrophica WOR_2 bacterium RIFCSPLOWO2_12_FULL_50_9]
MTTIKLKIRLYGDPCLRKKSIPVPEVGPPERALIQSMMATMHEHKGIGLAAPQVCIHQRIFVADIGEGPLAFVNPKIIRYFGSGVLEEGCLSIPGVTVMVRRPEKIVVRYLDEHNQPVEKACEALLARVIQHETDHLDGRLIVDYAGFKERIKLRKQLKAIQESQEMQ